MSSTGRFQSNLSCVLNDPKKSRTEIASFFTKTWGNSFIDRCPSPLLRLGDFNLSEFDNYFLSLRQSEKYGRPRLIHSTSPTTQSDKTHSLLNIPQMFLSSQFRLTDPLTFDLVYPALIPSTNIKMISLTDSNKCRTQSTSSDKSESSNRRQSISTCSQSVNPSTTNSCKHSTINSTSRLLQDKYNHYLDEIELLITRALATKSDCFHDAVRSHDEIQMFLNQTRHAISSLRHQLNVYDKQSLLTLIHLYRSLRQRTNQRTLLKRLQSLSIVKQTHSQIRTLLTTSDYLSALDLIDVTKEILSNQFNHLFAFKFYEAQFNELYLLIINLMRQEFQQCLIEQLNKNHESTKSIDFLDDDKFQTILIGLIRVHDEFYFNQIDVTFEQVLFDRIEQTRSLFFKDFQLEKSNKILPKLSVSDSSNSTTLSGNLDDSVRSSCCSTVNSPTSTNFSSWLRLATNVIHSIQHSLTSIELICQILHETLIKQDSSNRTQLNEIMSNLSEKIEERLISVFNNDLIRFQINFERLSIDEYSQLRNLIESFVEFEKNFHFQSSKCSRPLKSYLQGQTSKFLNSFHDQRKSSLITILENEQWKQVQIPRSIQNSLDDFYEMTTSSCSDVLIVEGDTFVLCSSCLHLLMLILDYCSCAQILSFQSINDVEHRLIELLNLFNSKTCQLVLGAGAVKLGRIRTISAKILALTCRCLQFIKRILPKIKLHFDRLQTKFDQNSSKSSLSSIKQIEQLTKLYSEHIDEIHGKLITIIEMTFDETLSTYEVRAPMPSDSFRTLVTRHIAAFYNAVAKIVSPTDLILLFTRLNAIFKHLLSKRLRHLKIANDGGPQHGLLTSDLLYYIKQVQSLPGLEMLELHIEEIWTNH